MSQKEERKSIEISKYSIKDFSSENMQNNSEGFLFLGLPDMNSLLNLGGTSPENFGLYLCDIINSSWSKAELKGDIITPLSYWAR